MQAIEEIVSFLADPESSLRWLAGSALSILGGAQVEAAVRAFLEQNPSPEARQEAERFQVSINLAVKKC